MGKIDGDFFISNKEKSCIICKKLTNRIEISSEKRVCSNECLKALYDETFIKKAIYIRFCGFDQQQFDIIDKIFIIEDNLVNILMKSTEENFIEIFVRISNFLGDYALLNSYLLDSLIEAGDIICFEKNKKTIKNKSNKFDCYLNIEMKTLNSYLQVQLIDIPNKDIKSFQNIYFIKNSLTI